MRAPTYGQTWAGIIAQEDDEHKRTRLLAAALFGACMNPDRTLDHILPFAQALASRVVNIDGLALPEPTVDADLIKGIRDGSHDFDDAIRGIIGG